MAISDGVALVVLKAAIGLAAGDAGCCGPSKRMPKTSPPIAAATAVMTRGTTGLPLLVGSGERAELTIVAPELTDSSGGLS